MSKTKSINLQPAYLSLAEDFRNNPGQWRAYESTGNCVVLAGPGSGKTKLLTTKMARIIHEDIRAPQGVACITYSSECARELKKRLDDLGIEESKNAYIGTIHGFCLNHIIRPYAKLAGYPLPDPVKVIDEKTKKDFLLDSCKELKITNISYIDSTLDNYRRTYLDRNDKAFFETIKYMPALIEKFEGKMRNSGYIDFDDMVLIGLNLIKQHTWVRRALKSRYPVIVIDEYQDLGAPLHQIILELAFKANVRIVAVGDPDQSIYGFNGAQPHLLRELSELEQVEQVTLGFNYRCAKKIVKNSVVALGEHRNYESTSGEDGEIYFWECPDGIEEQSKVVCEEIIPSLLSKKSSIGNTQRTLGNIAILYLDKYDSAKITTVVKKYGFPYAGGDREATYRQTPVTRWLEDCASWCAGGWKLGIPRLSTLIRFWLNLHQNIGLQSDEKSLRQALVSYLWSHREPNQNLNVWLEGILLLGLMKNLQLSQTRIDEVESLANLISAVNDLSRMGNFNISAFGSLRGTPDHLNLVTLHSSKGLEFDAVIMIGLEQGRIPNYRAVKDNDKNKLMEERRKFYVGLTRARSEVHLVYSGWYKNQYGKYESGPSEYVLQQQKIVNNTVVTIPINGPRPEA